MRTYCDKIGSYFYFSYTKPAVSAGFVSSMKSIVERLLFFFVMIGAAQLLCSHTAVSPPEKLLLISQCSVCRGCEIGVNKSIEVAVHNGGNIAIFKPGAMILGKGIGHENIRPNLTAPCNLCLTPLNILNFIIMLAFLDFHQLGTQHPHGNITILVLTALVLAGYNNACGDMGDTDGGFGFIDVLPACTA